MNRLVATAPGKAVLLGEYAVLDGAPALSLALDRRARVLLEPCSDEQCEVAAPQIGERLAGFRIRDGAMLAWRDAGAAHRMLGPTGSLLEHMVAHAGERFGVVQPFRLHIDTGALFIESSTGPVKLGLGSSAAVAVALDAAISAHASGKQARESPDAVLQRLLPVYRGTQRGHGSGIDLATSLQGGLIAYRVVDTAIETRPESLPDGLHLLFVWSGQPASTTDLVAAWRRAGRHQPTVLAELLEALSEVCRSGIEAVERNDAEALARQMGAYGRLLGTMGDQLDLPIVTEMHQQAMTLTERAGAWYKPCGAGGGDLGVAVSTDPQRLAGVAKDLANQGLETLPMAMDENGVRLHLS